MKVTNLMRKALPLKKCGAVIVAAGNASRMGGIDKVMAQLKGEPMIARTVRTFQNCDCISEIVIVTREDLILPITNLTREMPKVKAVVRGGSSRQESVNLGLNALSKEIQLAAIHDGARPLISMEVIDRTVRAAHTHSAAAPAIPVKDTIKV
ncbi:MAG: 2-C-methyl-D-erythritol 4-phosphate cytidylyltransferase, partial [Oscillospiraceae bacterium]|nr:2-C-methyl-D-erythritol 4-phosphate cytidylyltransferase [Oscillospiraceae bacterium]